MAEGKLSQAPLPQGACQSCALSASVRIAVSEDLARIEPELGHRRVVGHSSHREVVPRWNRIYDLEGPGPADPSAPVCTKDDSHFWCLECTCPPGDPYS